VFAELQAKPDWRRVLACKTIGLENRRLCTVGGCSKSTATGVVKAPEFARMSLVERQAQVETARAVLT
jgi:hypothetical protein